MTRGDPTSRMRRAALAPTHQVCGRKKPESVWKDRPSRAAASVFRRGDRRPLYVLCGFAHQDVDGMYLAVVREDDYCRITRHTDAIHRHAGDSLAATLWVFHDNCISRGSMPEIDFELRPAAGNHGIDHKRFAAHPDAEHIFDRHPVHPSSRSRIPSPAAATDIGRHGIDITARHIGLDP